MRHFRSWVGSTASALPPKYISDRVLPWVALLTAIMAASSALAQYANNLSIARVSTTMELHKTYLSTTFEAAKKAFANLSTVLGSLIDETRCLYLLEATPSKNKLISSQACDPPTDYTLKLINSVELSSDQRLELRGRIRQRLQTYARSTPGLAQDISQLEIFFRSVVHCANRRVCSGGTASAIFGREMVSFINTTCMLEEAGTSKSINMELARFLISEGVHRNIYWSTDGGREKLFICEHLRVLER